MIARRQTQLCHCHKMEVRSRHLLKHLLLHKHSLSRLLRTSQELPRRPSTPVVPDRQSRNALGSNRSLEQFVKVKTLRVATLAILWIRWLHFFEVKLSSVVDAVLYPDRQSRLVVRECWSRHTRRPWRGRGWWRGGTSCQAPAASTWRQCVQRKWWYMYTLLACVSALFHIRWQICSLQSRHLRSLRCR